MNIIRTSSTTYIRRIEWALTVWCRGRAGHGPYKCQGIASLDFEMLIAPSLIIELLHLVQLRRRTVGDELIPWSASRNAQSVSGDPGRSGGPGGFADFKPTGYSTERYLLLRHGRTYRYM